MNNLKNFDFLVYYGVKLPWNEDFYEEWEERYSDMQDFAPIFLEMTPEEEAVWDRWPDILFDDRCQEYMVLGVEMSKRKATKADVLEMFAPNKTHAAKDVEKKAKIYTAQFIEWFPEFRHLVEVPFNFLTVLHHPAWRS